MGHPITPLWIDGFEHGRATGGAATSAADAVGGTPAIVTTPVRTDTRALEITAAGVAESYRYTVANRVCTAAFAVRYATLPTADHVLFHFVNTGNDGQIRFVNASDRFGTSIQNVDTQVFGPNPIVVNTWYLIVVECDSSGSSIVTRARCFDATTGAQIGTQATSTVVQAALDTTTLGFGTQSAETFTIYFDDFVLSVTDGDYEDWPHLWRIQSLIPTADGTHAITTSGDFDSFTGTAFSNATTTGWSFIDHRPLQVANTANAVIRQELGTTANYMELLPENCLAVSALITQDTQAASNELYGGTGTFERLAQSFLLASDTLVTGVSLNMSKVASPADNITLDVVSTLDGSSLASVTIAASSVVTGNISFTFASPVTLTAGAYYLQLSRSGARDTVNYCTWRRSTTSVYADGDRWSRGSGTWSQSTTTDFYFILYQGTPATDNVLAVRAYGTHIESSTTGGSLGEMRLLLADNTEVLTTGSLSVIDSTEDPGTTVTTRKRMTIPPTGGWSRDKVDESKIRVGFGDNDPDVNFIDAMLEVLLVTGSLPPVSAPFHHMLVR